MCSSDLNRLIAFGAVLLMVAFCALGQTTFTNSITYTTTYNLPPIGLAPSETLQINLVNTAAALPTTTAATPAPCTGSVVFLNANGTLVGTQTNFTIGSGKIFSVPLPGSSLASRTIIRAQIVNTVTVTETITGVAIPEGPSVTAIFAPPSCALGSSLEIFDTATGAMHAFIAGSSSTSAVPVPAVAIRTGDFNAAQQN